MSGKTSSIAMQDYDLMEQFFCYSIDVKSYEIIDKEKHMFTAFEIAVEYQKELRAAYYENKELLLALTNSVKSECIE